MREFVRRRVLGRIRRRYGLLPMLLRAPLGIRPYTERRAGLLERAGYVRRMAAWQFDCWLYDLAYPYPVRERDIMEARWANPASQPGL